MPDCHRPEITARIRITSLQAMAVWPYATRCSGIVYVSPSGFALHGSLLLSGLAALLGRNVSRPVGQLAAAVRRVQAGDYSQPVAGRGSDEIADLAAAFGSMQGEIGAREQRILHQAHHDGLTGLPNRLRARTFLEDLLARSHANGNGFAVLILDLDRFKEINDTLGHDFADQVLVEVGKRMTRGVPRHDLVERLGSDQFMLLL